MKVALLLSLSAPTWGWVSPLSSVRSPARVTPLPEPLSLSATVEEGAEIAENEKVFEASTSSDMAPEYVAANEAAVAKLEASLPKEMQPAMMPLLKHFLGEYLRANQDGFEAGNVEDCRPDVAAKRILTAMDYGLKYGTGPNKYQFDVSHTALRGKDSELEDGNEIDFYAFGCNFFKPVMDLENSLALGVDERMPLIQKQLEAGENVVFFANHQSEADPQVFSACLEMKGYEKEAAEIVYVAGHKVTTDPLAVPFSMGRNLICIHSKKHIDAEPELKPVKQRQNLRAMGSLLDKFKKGGTLLWVAPSGGRDRRNVETGEVPLAPFDRKTIDMFRLMGNKSKKPTHYYTLAMETYQLCPPPDFLEAGTGEPRNVRYVPVGIHLGEECPSVGGIENRKEFKNHAMKQCEEDYATLLEALKEKSSSEE